MLPRLTPSPFFLSPSLGVPPVSDSPVHTSFVPAQCVAFGLFVTPLFLMWEKVVGVHYSKFYAIRAAARVPVVLLIWFLAVAFPFFGPINSIIGAFSTTFSTYLIPSLMYIIVYRTAAAREVQGKKEIELDFSQVWNILLYSSPLQTSLWKTFHCPCKFTLQLFISIVHLSHNKRSYSCYTCGIRECMLDERSYLSR